MAFCPLETHGASIDKSVPLGNKSQCHTRTQVYPLGGLQKKSTATSGGIRGGDEPVICMAVEKTSVVEEVAADATRGCEESYERSSHWTARRKRAVGGYASAALLGNL